MIHSPENILTYCHIGKVGGKRLQFYLRTHFGFRYRCVARVRGAVYTREQLESDLKWNPRIKYLGGHCVRPHIDYGPLNSRLRWFSLFRDPMTRVLSHYYQQTVIRNFQVSGILDWLRKYPNRAYWQIYMLSGENNLAKAKAIIHDKYSFVGINERYEQSLFLLAKTFGLKGFHFNDGRLLPRPEKNRIHQTIKEDFEKYQDDILDLLKDEFELYDFIKTRYEQQCADYGIEKLDQELDTYLCNATPLRKYNINNLAAATMDRLFWRAKYQMSR